MPDDFSQAPNIITGSIDAFASASLFVTKSDPDTPIDITDVNTKAGVILFHQYESMFKQLNVAIQDGTLGAGGGGADPGASYVVMGATGSLANERVLTKGLGLTLTDSGAGGAAAYDIDDDIVATVSGTTFTGLTVHDAGLVVSGSTLKLGGGTQTNYLALDGGGGGVQNVIQFLTTGTYNWGIYQAASKNLVFDRYWLGSGEDSVIANAQTGEWTFPTTVKATGGFSGSLTALTDGTPYIRTLGGISITTESNGSLIISGSTDTTIPSEDTGADIGAQYVLIGNTASLPNERALTAGTGVTVTDGGAGSTATLAINDLVVATVSGTQFTGNIQAPIVTASLGFSGSLTALADGTPYLRALGAIAITTESNGSLIISGSGGGGAASGAPVGGEYVVLTVNGTLTDERVLTAGSGVTVTDGGAGNAVTLAVDDNVVATVSGTTFTGVVKADTLSGSLTALTDGTPYIRTLGGISITTESNGSLIISGSTDTTIPAGDAGADAEATFVLMGATASLANERALTGGTGISLTDGGAGSTATLAIDDLVVATVSGSTFTGITNHNAGLSGSLTHLTDGTSAIIAGAEITITSESNGATTISKTTPGGPDAFVGDQIDFATTASIVHTMTNGGALVLSATNPTFDKSVMLIIGSTDGGSTVEFSSDFRMISGSEYIATSGTINLFTMYCRDDSTPIIDYLINQED